MESQQEPIAELSLTPGEVKGHFDNSNNITQKKAIESKETKGVKERANNIDPILQSRLL